MPIEPIDTRYTAQWYEHVPALLGKHFQNYDIIQIDGDQVSSETSAGAFLNFAATNVYKSTQFAKLAKMINDGLDNAYVLYTDAWNPTVIQLRYMIDLLGLDIKIGGLWHAGSYDKHDFLGRAAGDKAWANHSELAMFHSFDHNFFATSFHENIFAQKYSISWSPGTMILTGWPMEYLRDTIPEATDWKDKENIILFPHRIAPEKQIEVFRELEKIMPDYQFIACQEKKLTKTEYHDLLRRSKFVFSASLQETLGISWVEGLIAGCIPILPNRLSYQEMWTDLYPSSASLEIIAEFIRSRDNLDRAKVLTNRRRVDDVLYTFFNARDMIWTLKYFFNDTQKKVQA
jgi:glycosyltransferase involved in cell wall biosynthesis